MLLSYPFIESLTASNYIDNTFKIEMDTGDELKSYLHQFYKFTNQKINQDTIILAVNEMVRALASIGLDDYNLDNFSETNLKIYEYEANHYLINKKYKLLSLLCISLLDLGLINIED